VQAALQAIRTVVPPLEADRILTPDVQAVRQLMLSGALRRAVEAVVGPLH
jgi:histidine ammonia-lyase